MQDPQHVALSVEIILSTHVGCSEHTDRCVSDIDGNHESMLSEIITSMGSAGSVIDDGRLDISKYKSVVPVRFVTNSFDSTFG